jgi:hypothetical protein
MRKLSLLALVGFFFLNPGLACGPAEPEYQYGAAEMRAAVEGDWVVTITPESGAPVEYGVNLKQSNGVNPAAARPVSRALVRQAHACGARTLVASANACEDYSEMPLTVTLAPNSPPTSGSLIANYRVWSLVFTTGDLDLALGAYHVSAQIKADGTVTSASLSPPGPSGAATMRRL